MQCPGVARLHSVYRKQLRNLHNEERPGDPRKQAASLQGEKARRCGQQNHVLLRTRAPKARLLGHLQKARIVGAPRDVSVGERFGCEPAPHLVDDVKADGRVDGFDGGSAIEFALCNSDVGTVGISRNAEDAAESSAVGLLPSFSADVDGGRIDGYFGAGRTVGVREGLRDIVPRDRGFLAAGMEGRHAGCCSFKGFGSSRSGRLSMTAGCGQGWCSVRRKSSR